MRKFKVTKRIEVVCESKSTRNGFKHEATLLLDGQSQDSVKINYLNRTWERFEFQSVMEKLSDKTSHLSTDEKKVFTKFLEKDQTDWSGFNTVSAVAKLGDVFCENKKDSNDWKARMIKAGLGHQGLTIPDDWDTLDEDTKEKRLDAVIKLAGDK